MASEFVFGWFVTFRRTWTFHLCCVLCERKLLTANCNKPIMFQFPTVWVDNNPDSLLDIALRYCINHQNVFCKYNKTTDNYDELLDDLPLPVGICERLLYLSKTEMTEDRFKQFTTLFKDPARTHLRNLDLSDSIIDDHNLEILTRHNIAELNISNCKRLTRTCLPYITKHRNSLVSLNVGDSIQIFLLEDGNNPQLGEKAEDAQSLDPHNKTNQPSNNEEVFSELCLPFLRKLVINGLKTKHYLGSILKSSEYLTYLDFSNCNLDCDALECLSAQKQLTSLILCDVMGFAEYVPAICRLKSLRHLDISHTSQISVMWHQNPNEALKSIVESLENLESLDISGTNLAGGPTTKRKSPESDDTKGENLTDIPGLASRVNRPLEFLGLLNTAHDACFRHHIPAKRIAGHAAEEQILIAGQAYCGREQIIQKILSRLVWSLRSSTCRNTRLALDVIMEAMRLHPKKQNIQAAGSVSLYSIVKEDMKLFNPRMKQKIIKALLDAMCSHPTQINLLKYALSALSHFKIPEEVYFVYERLVSLLLLIVVGPIEFRDEVFVQCCGLSLLNHMGCQVDGFYRKLVGDKGAITIMLQLIQQRLETNYRDEVIEIAWSIMWNATDETPINCARFIEGGGLDLFLRCLQTYPEKPELLRSMTGVLGNIAEITELRTHLMKDKYLSVFSDLLDRKSDGIEVTYNVAGILSHIASDEEVTWARHKIISVKRKEVLTKMVNAIEKWDLDTKTVIIYRSFEPILQLLNVEHTPAIQHWAVWALANLTKVNPEKYCPLLREEGGIDILMKFLMKPGHSRILELAEIVIKQCERYESGENEDCGFDDTS